MKLNSHDGAAGRCEADMNALPAVLARLVYALLDDGDAVFSLEHHEQMHAGTEVSDIGLRSRGRP